MLWPCAMMILTLQMAIAVAQAGPAIDVTNGPVATTTVAVQVALDPSGRVMSCRPAGAGEAACVGFPKGRIVSLPIRRNGKPVSGKMTVSTTTVVSGE